METSTYGSGVVSEGAPNTSSAVVPSAAQLVVPGGLDLVSPRPRSDAGASIAARLRMGERSSSIPHRSGQSAGALAVQKAAQESMMVNTIKRQMESMEDKVEAQLVKVQQHGDRLREAAFSRLDSKVSSAEAMQLKFDRKLAELSGNYKGLSEEMQSQIRRLDGFDTKLWDWRHQVDEENRVKFAEVDSGVQKIMSQLNLNRATSEEAINRMWNRVRRLEEILEERLGMSDETSLNIATLDSRLQEIEAARLQDLSLSLAGSAALVPARERDADIVLPGDSGAALVTLEARVAESIRKFEQTSGETKDLQTRMEAQEVRLSTLRTMVDKKEESYRVQKFDRQDWESKVKEFQHTAEGLERHRLRQNERLDIFENRLGSHDKVIEDVQNDVARLQDKTLLNLEAMSAAPREADGANKADLAILDKTFEECSSRLTNTEEQIKFLGEELNMLRADADLAPRVASVVDMLKNVAPKVMDQEMSVRELSEKMGYLEGKMNTSIESQGNGSLGNRLGNLEVIVGRLKMEIEGTEAPDSGGS